MQPAYTWYKLFTSKAQLLSKIPEGKTLLLKAGTTEICLANTPDGLFAVENACSHLQARLHEGVINSLNEIVCPWHHYRFCLKTGVETSSHGCSSLETYPLKTHEDGSLYIGLKL